MAKIKRTVSAILSVLIAASAFTAAPVSVSAATQDAPDAGAKAAVTRTAEQADLIIAGGSCGEKLNWSFSDKGILEISGEGRMPDFDPGAKEDELSYIPWNAFLGQIKKVVVKDGTEYLGNNAFKGCKELEKVEIADSVKEFGENVFADCDKLDKTSLPQAFTEPVTEETTEALTEAATDFATEAITEAVTEAASETVTEAFTEETIEEETAGEEEAQTEEPTDRASKKSVKEEEEAVGAADISKCTITLDTTSYTYDGTAKKPAVTVKNGTKTLVKGTDYTLAYKNNTNAGTATATVTGKGSYAGTLSKTYTIKKRAISTATIKLSTGCYIYDGTAKKPTVTATYNSTALKLNEDFTVSYKDNINVGKATVTITGKKNFSGTATKNFDIQKKSIKKCTITLSATTYTYNGKAKRPTVTVKDGDTVLQIGSDFGPTYTNNINAGTATVTISGLGNYGESVTKEFTIKPKSVSGLTVTPEYTETVYDGNLKRPSAVVMDGTAELASGTDYTLGYSNNREAGTASLIVTGKGNYTGKKTIKFTIKPKDISKLSYSIDASKLVYDGTGKIPDIIVKDGSKTLVNGVNYVTEFKNNINAGTATVTFTGTGSYCGTLSKNYTIKAKPIAQTTVILSATSFEYNGKAQTPTVTVKDGDKTLTVNKDYTYTVTDNQNAGTATVKLTGKGNYSGTATQTFSINAKQISKTSITVSPTSVVYNGKSRYPSVTVKDGSTTLTKGTDYTLSYSKNKDAGTASIVIKGINNYTGSVTKSFTIKAKPLSETTITLSATEFVYNGSAQTPAITVKDGETTLVLDKDYTVAVSNNINKGTATIKLTGKDNYSGSVSKTFTIKAKSVKNTTVTLSKTSYVYSGSANTPDVVVKDGETVLTKGTDYSVTYSNNTNVGTAKATVKGMGNYADAVDKTFTIKAKSVSTGTVSLSFTQTQYTGKAITPSVSVKLDGKTLSSQNDYTVSYKNNTSVGTATVTVTAKNNYSGTLSSTFKIVARPLSGLDLTVNDSSCVYTGSAVNASVTLKYGTTTLKKDTDYTLSFSNNVNAGTTAKVTITGKGNYTGTLNKNYTIKQKSISGGKVTFKAYNTIIGSNDFTFALGTKPLVYDKDYTFAYKNGENFIGIQPIVITGKGNYTGSVEYTDDEMENAMNGRLKIKVDNINGYKTSEGDFHNSIFCLLTVSNPEGGTKEATLCRGAHFRVAYERSEEDSMVKVTITGCSQYSGTVVRAYEDIFPKFIWGYDNWNFNNSYTYFPSSMYGNQLDENFVENYDISDPTDDPPAESNIYMRTLLSRLSDSELYYLFDRVFGSQYTNMYAYWSGSCYGMSALTLLAKKGYFDTNAFQTGKEYLNQFSCPKYDSNVKSLITYYQILQNTSEISSSKISVLCKSDKQNLDNLFSIVSSNNSTILGFYFYPNYPNTDNYFGHAVYAYGYADGNWTFGDYNYQRCIYVCDPNASANNSNYGYYNLYYNTETYDWAIPGYFTDHKKVGAHFNSMESDPHIFDRVGYLSPALSYTGGTAYGRLNAAAASGNCVASKAERITENGGYIPLDDNDDIFGDYYNYENVGTTGNFGYNFSDMDSAYIVTQETPDKLSLNIDYDNCSFDVESEAGMSAVLDKDGFISVEGEAASYNLRMTYNDSHSTDWATVKATGDNASTASLKMVEGGYVLSADNLENVQILANNRNAKATAQFSTKYNSVFIYEIDENTIGLRVDADNNGTFETELSASNNGVITGDVNSDGEVNVFDVTVLRNYLSELAELSENQKLAADANGDGRVSVADVYYLQLMIAEFV